jgi:3D (Asp-Asp-Asp) domain-containing protein
VGVEVLFILTAYAYGCGATGLTKTERPPASDRTVAVDPRVVPMFGELAIEGIGVRYAEDTGPKVKGNRIDVFMDSCEAAREFGVQRRYVMLMPPKRGRR